MTVGVRIEVEQKTDPWRRGQEIERPMYGKSI